MILNLKLLGRHIFWQQLSNRNDKHTSTQQFMSVPRGKMSLFFPYEFNAQSESMGVLIPVLYFLINDSAQMYYYYDYFRINLCEKRFHIAYIP